MKNLSGMVCFLLAVLIVATQAQAGGVDPKELPPEAAVVREKPSATPAQTSAAVSKARLAVAPAVEERPVVKPLPSKQADVVARPAQGDNWQVGTGKGSCTPLSSISRQVKNIGAFKTPEEFAYQMKQRGYQAFVLDVGDARDQMLRVKVPDLDLDLLFVRSGLCR